ncbi:MAG: hypothetical protein EOM54_09760 [Clostridia bacterium]|nr:hypothetical protein [Clostridia bacterium]
MEPTETEILQEILEAEKEASKIYNEALQLRKDQDARIERGKDKLKIKYADKVKEAIAEAEKAEAERTSAEIRRIEEETKARLITLRGEFEQSRAGYADTLLNLVIGETNE